MSTDGYSKALSDLYKALDELPGKIEAASKQAKSDEERKETAYLLFEKAVRAKAKELNGDWVADWNRQRQKKFQITYQGSQIYIDYWYESNFSLVRGSECKDYETAEELIKHFGKEKFRAYATGGEL